MVSYVPGSAPLPASQNSNVFAMLLRLFPSAQSLCTLYLHAFLFKWSFRVSEVNIVTYKSKYLTVLFPPPREAEGFKEQGNAFYVKKDYAEAFNYYTKAIGKKGLLSGSHGMLIDLLIYFHVQTCVLKIQVTMETGRQR